MQDINVKIFAFDVGSKWNNYISSYAIKHKDDCQENE